VRAEAPALPATGEGLDHGTAELFFGDTETRPNGFHLTGFLAPDPIIYIRHAGGETLCVSALEIERARAESSVGEVIEFREAGYEDLSRAGNEGMALWSGMILNLLRRHGVERVLVEDEFPVGLADRLRAGDVEVAPQTTRFDSRRRVKSADEVEAMVLVQRANEAAVSAAIDAIRRSRPRADRVLELDGEPLTSERIKLILGTELMARGCALGEVIVASGADSALPHGRGSGPIRAGEPVIIDCFPQHVSSRMHADMTRTVVWGDPDPLVQRMYDAVLAAQDAALGLIRAGVDGRDVHREVCRTLFEHGFRTLMKPYDTGDSEAVMNHGTGHGLGLAVHEAPRVSDTHNILQEGDVVTVEPGLYHPRLGGVRIEDVVVVTADGCRNLMEMPKTFRL
jgi:Xaa-Pro aminopeptidase